MTSKDPGEPTPFFQSGPVDGFARWAAFFLLAFVGLYAVYAVGAFVALAPTTPVANRLVSLLGMAAFPLPLLAAPATYLAALDRFDLYGDRGPGVRHGHWTQLGFLALGTCVVMFMGPFGYESALQVLAGPYETVLLERTVGTNHARFMLPLAVALFVIVSAVGGAVAGRVTGGLSRGARYAVRWTVGAALLGSFLATMVVTADLIAMRGVLSPAWLALAPPAVPFALVCMLARRDCARAVRSMAARAGLRRQDRAYPAEVGALVHGLKEVAAPAVAVDEPRVRKIVAGLTDTANGMAGVEISRPTGGRREGGSWRLGEMAGGFAGSWAYLSVGFLWLGGAGLSPPTVVSALSAGLIGAAGAVLSSR